MTMSSLTGSLPAALSPVVNPRAQVEAAFDRFSPAVYRYVLIRVGGDPHLADDIMQQLWLAVSGNHRRVPGDELEFWLRGIARNLVRQHWRQIRRRPSCVPLADPALGAELAARLADEELPSGVLQRKQVQDQLILALTALSSQDQALISGRYFQGRSNAELACDLDLTERAVEGRLYRARQSLHQQLRELDL
ncbi:MAG: RNA polymerase sigma factor [Phycisphaerae bacterium]